MLLILASIWLLLVVWLIRRALQQRELFPELPASAAPEATSRGAAPPKVAVIVPARDEAPRIRACVASVLAQHYRSDRLQVVAVDDESSDGTGQILDALAVRDARMTVLRAPPLPPGWKGKVHACTIGAQAVADDVPWLCFIDADMRAEPLLIASAVQSAQARGLDLLSLAPRHELRSVAERLLLPCGMYLLGFAQDLARVQAPDSDQAVATGQFMLIARAAYERVGGHAAVRAAICEDVQLALRMKRMGHRVLMQAGTRLLSTRMYTGWRTLWPGFAKNLTEMLGGPVRTVLMALVSVTCAWAALLLPLVSGTECLRGSTLGCVALVPAALGSAAVFALHIAGALHFGIPVWYGLIFPLGYSAGALLALDSVRWRLAGRVRWKGRVYP